MRYQITITCPYCEHETLLEVPAGTGIIHKHRWCNNCQGYQQLCLTFDNRQQLLSMIVSRAPEPGIPLN